MTAVTPTDFRIVVQREESPLTVPSGESISSRKGKYCRVDGTTGKAMLGNSSSSGEVGGIHGFAMSNQRFVGDAVTLFRDGILDWGSGLDSLSVGATVYLADVDSTYADAAGTATQAIGKVINYIESDGSLKKMLDVDLTS